MTQQKLAVQSGHWPLYRYRPSGDGDAQPFQLDSAEPSVAYADFAGSEARFAMLARSNPERAKELVELAQADVDTRCDYYRQLADVHRTAPGHAGDTTIADERGRAHDRSDHHLPRVCTLRSPLVASAGPLTGDPTMWQRLEDAGAGAIVLPSLFEEEIEHEAFAVDFADRARRRPVRRGAQLPARDADRRRSGPARHLALVEKARETLSIPVIASLNGTSPGGWVRYAKHLADAGAHAIELNLYDVVVDPPITVGRGRAPLRRTGGGGARRDLRPAGREAQPVVHRARQPRRAAAGGRRRRPGAVQPAVPARHRPRHARRSCRGWRSATPAESRLPLHWIANLRGSLQLLARGQLRRARRRRRAEAAARRRRRGDDDQRAVAARPRAPGGRSSGSSASGWSIATTSRSTELRGSVSRENVPDPQVYERANYYQVIHSWRPDAHR